VNELRKKLREETSCAHKSLDFALSCYDLTSRNGLANYLNVHLLVRDLLAKTHSGHEIEIDHSDSIAAIRSDLTKLGVSVVEDLHWMPKSYLHPVGLTYVIAGSSLGSKVLYKKWAQSTDDSVILAGEFMALAVDNSDWLKFLEYIDATSFSDSETDDIVMSANQRFTLYKTAAQQVDRNTR